MADEISSSGSDSVPPNPLTDTAAWTAMVGMDDTHRRRVLHDIHNQALQPNCPLDGMACTRGLCTIPNACQHNTLGKLRRIITD